MQSVYKNLNGIQTQLLTWGNPFDCNGSDVIVCVTGNPGIPDFYIEFASELHKSTGFPVCVVGHAGHAQVPDKESNVLKDKKHLFNLQGQLGHKLDLINEHIDQNSRLHLVGHSIGAWLIVELLEKNEHLIGRVSSINLLFPTLQRMAESRNGKFFNGVLRRLNFLAILFFMFVNLLPGLVRLMLVNLYIKYHSLPSHYSERILKYFNPNVAEKVLFLAYNEMDVVVTLNTNAIDKVKHLTNVIYSTKDGWAPVWYMDDLKTFRPPLQMKKVNIRHAFVLKSSESVAEMASDFITSKC